jgi:8-oxo-dGTP diphosphatase
MSYEPKAHKKQIVILRHLLFTPTASFSDLQRTAGLTSDHATFHIKKLIEEGYVEKKATRYQLTNKGKEYANRLDTDDNTIEKQPKISVAITIESINSEGQRQFLFQQRKKNPYFDFWGRAGGKVRWGESIFDAANRELQEETGLSAQFEDRILLYHKRDFERESGRLLEDKMFMCVYANSFTGDLVKEFEGGINQWMTLEEFQKQPKRFTSVDEFIELYDSGETFVERMFYYDETEY